MRGEGRGGKALAGRDGEPALAACPCSARALARSANCGLRGPSSCWGWRSAAAARPWHGGGEPIAGGNWIPGDGVGICSSVAPETSLAFWPGGCKLSGPGASRKAAR